MENTRDEVQILRDALGLPSESSPQRQALQTHMRHLQQQYESICEMLRRKRGWSGRGNQAAENLPDQVGEFMKRHRQSRELAVSMCKELAQIGNWDEGKIKKSALPTFVQSTNTVLALAKQVYAEASAANAPRSASNDQRPHPRSGASQSQSDQKERITTVMPAISGSRAGVESSRGAPVPHVATAEPVLSIELFQRSLAAARSQLGDLTTQVDALLRQADRETEKALRQAQDERRQLADTVKKLQGTLSQRVQEHEQFMGATRTDIIQLLDSAFPLWSSTQQDRQGWTDSLRTPSRTRREPSQDFVTVSANTLIEHLLSILRDRFGLIRIVVSPRDKFDSTTMIVAETEPTEDPYFDQSVAQEVKWGYRTAGGEIFRQAEVIVFKLRGDR